jgi:plastocyanin
MNRIVLLSLLVASAATFVTPASAVVVPPEVTVLAATFLPPVVVVPPGGTVYWQSEEANLHHQVTAWDGSFSVHLMPNAAPWTCDPDPTHWPNTNCAWVVMNQPSGTVVPYRCSFHPFMNGVIVVA